MELRQDAGRVKKFDDSYSQARALFAVAADLRAADSGKRRNFRRPEVGGHLAHDTGASVSATGVR